MCFAVNQENKKAIEKQLEFWTKRELTIIGWTPKRWMDAFSRPLMPVLLNDFTADIAQWGLIPHWARTEQQVKTIQLKTLNCKSETMFQRPSFRDSAPTRRCLIPVNSFFEYQHREGGKLKIPYQIQVNGAESTFLAGLWSNFGGLKTFTIITMPANTLMSTIHNSKLRMPVIVPDNLVEKWFSTPSATEVQPFFQPRDDIGLVAEETQGKPNNGHDDLPLLQL